MPLMVLSARRGVSACMYFLVSLQSSIKIQTNFELPPGKHQNSDHVVGSHMINVRDFIFMQIRPTSLRILSRTRSMSSLPTV